MGLELFLMQNRIVEEFKLRSYSLELRQTTLRLLAATAIFVVYLVIGAAVFSSLESPVEKKEVTDLRKFKQNLLSSKTCLTSDELEDIIARVSVAVSMGMSPLKNVSFEPNWSFGQSILFSGSLITTVGYGKVSPATQSGKAFTIVFCILGIPFTLALLGAFVERLKVPTTWLLGKMNSRLGHLYQPTQILFFHLGLVFSLLLILLFIIPSAIFTAIEPNWTFLDAFYYCFISLTTIGLGDFTPGDHPNQPNRALYKIITTAYLLIGLCCMLLALATMYDIPQLNFSRYLLTTEKINEEDTERIRLANKTSFSGPKYSSQVDERDSIGASPSSTVSAGMNDNNHYQTPYH